MNKAEYYIYTLKNLCRVYACITGLSKYELAAGWLHGELTLASAAGKSACSFGRSGLTTAPDLILPLRDVVSLVKREQVGVSKPSIDVLVLHVCIAAPTSLLLLLTGKQQAPVSDTSASSRVLLTKIDEYTAIPAVVVILNDSKCFNIADVLIFLSFWLVISHSRVVVFILCVVSIR